MCIIYVHRIYMYIVYMCILYARVYTYMYTVYVKYGIYKRLDQRRG